MSDRTILAGALESRYPWLTDSQRERLEAAMLRELAAAIAREEGIAIVRPLPDGSFEISRFAVEHADGNLTGHTGQDTQ